MTITAVDIDNVGRIRPGEEARTLAHSVYSAFLNDLKTLDPADWEVSTVCDPWTVADVVRHVLGAARATASNLEMARQQLKGFRNRKKFGGNALDATNDFQVEEHRHLSPPELISELRSLAPLAVERRMTHPALLQRVSLPTDQGGSTAPGMPSKLNLGDLFRVVYTRDVWLHRIDIAQALGRSPSWDRSVDGRIVADVLREWADRHRRPFDLTLTGPLEARYFRAGDGPALQMDPVQLCWFLSGRDDPDPDLPGSDLLTTRLFF